MEIERIRVLSFSPTGGTERIARLTADALAARLKVELEHIDLTRPRDRERDDRFGQKDLLVMASPVYAGRLPNKLMPEYRAMVHGSGGPAVALCAFGGRSPDEALRELVMLLEDGGFRVAGGAAFAVRHAFSDRIGAGRPDEADRAQIRSFAEAVAARLAGEDLPPLAMDRRPVGPYYTPLRADGTPARFLKARPVIDRDRCIRCGTCAELCPMGSIDPNCAETVGLCIKCQACIQGCPNGARQFVDEDFRSHVAMLERSCTGRTANEIIL